TSVGGFSRREAIGVSSKSSSPNAERFICTLAVLSASRWRVCRHVKVAWSYRPGGGDELRLVIGVESSAQRPHRSASCSHYVPASLTPLPDLLAHPVIRQAPY